MNRILQDKLVRIRNCAINRELSKWESIFCDIDSILNIQEFALRLQELRSSNNNGLIQYKCVNKESLFYGHLYSLLKYCSYDNASPFLMPVIEHGINFYETAFSKEYIYSVPSFIFQGPYKKAMIKKCDSNKPVFCIGPYIHYADTYYSKEKIETIKRKNGKTALFFPFHTFEKNGSRELNSMIELFRCEYKSKFDTLLVCLYWLDIDQQTIELLEKYGIKVVSAGARFDRCFMSRLKTIIQLSDCVIGDDIGSYIGYAIYEGKDINILFDNDALRERRSLLESKQDIYLTNQKNIITAINHNDTKLVDSFYKYFWGGKEALKSPGEIRSILDYSKSIVMKSWGMPNKYDKVYSKIGNSTI